MAILFEQIYPEIYRDGFNTNRNVTIAGTSNFDMSGSSGSFKFPTGTVTGSGVMVGGKANIIPSGAATVQITAAQSGSTFLFDSAAGVVYTLPAIAVGLTYSFFTSVSITSGAAEVATKNEGTDFIVGAVETVINASATTSGFSANGTTIVEVTSNGSTTGGLQGSWYNLTCINATQWACYGTLVGSGALATPFST